MKTGVSTTPWLSVSRPRRARPSVSSTLELRACAELSQRALRMAARLRGAAPCRCCRSPISRAAPPVPPPLPVRRAARRLRAATARQPPSMQALQRIETHRRDLRGEPQLRQPVRPVSRRRTASPTRRAEQKTQLDHDGNAAAATCRRSTTTASPTRASRALPNGPFRIDAPPINRAHRRDRAEPDPRLLPQPGADQRRHATTCSSRCRSVGGWTMGYYDGSHAAGCGSGRSDYTLADNFFMGAFGGSYLNHQWLICACTPRSRERAGGDARRSSTTTASSRSSPTRRRPVLARCRSQRRRRRRSRPTATSVNTSQPPYQPSGVPPAAGGNARARRSEARNGRQPVPPQTAKTIGDTLVGEGRVVGLVRRRLERGARRRPPAARARSARVIYNRERGQPDLPAAPPAVQLLRALRAGHRGPRAST